MSYLGLLEILFIKIKTTEEHFELVNEGLVHHNMLLLLVFKTGLVNMVTIFFVHIF